MTAEIGVAAGLLGVELDDELLLDRRVDDLPGREGVHQDAHPVAEHLEPRRHRAGAGQLAGDHERGELAGLLPHVDDVAGVHPVRRDVHLPAVHQHVPVPDELAGGVPGRREAGPVDHVVQPRLEDLQQDLTGLAGLAVGLLVVPAELLLQHAVDAAGLLLLAQLQQVFGVLGAAPAVLARRVGPDLDRALGALALAALEEQLHLLPPAAAAVGSGVTGHGSCLSFVLSPSDPAPLGRPAAVVRLRGDVLDLTDLEAGRLQRADRRLPARARALDEDVDPAHAVLLRLATGVLRGQLGRERGRLAGALEADVTGRGPGDHVPQRVADGHDRVVERALDVRVPVGDVLLLLAPDLLDSAGGRTGPGRHVPSLLLPSGLLLAGDGLLRPLAGPGVGLRALAVHRQAAAVPDTLVGADLDLPADVLRHLAAQVALDPVVGVDVVAQPDQVLVGQVAGAQVGVDAGRGQRGVRAGLADAVDVGERDLHPLLAGEVDAGEACHAGGAPSSYAEVCRAPASRRPAGAPASDRGWPAARERAPGWEALCLLRRSQAPGGGGGCWMWWRLALALLVAQVLADHHDPPVPADHLALVADRLDARIDLHGCAFSSVLPAAGPAGGLTCSGRRCVRGTGRTARAPRPLGPRGGCECSAGASCR